MESVQVLLSHFHGVKQITVHAVEPIGLDTTDRLDRGLSVALAESLCKFNPAWLPAILAWTICHIALTGRFDDEPFRRELTEFVQAARRLADKYEECSRLEEAYQR